MSVLPLERGKPIFALRFICTLSSLYENQILGFNQHQPESDDDVQEDGRNIKEQ